MIVYVDDMLMLAAPKDASSIWRDPERSINLTDLGGHYAFHDFDLKNPQAPRSLPTDMDEYAASAAPVA